MKIVIVSASIRTGRLSHHAALGLHLALQARPTLSPLLLDLKEVAEAMLQESFGHLSTPLAPITQVRKILEDADAFLFVTPEYNGSYSSALKNLVDIYPKSTFANKAVGIVTITTGSLGGMRAALQLQMLILAIWAIPSPHMLLVPSVQNKFDEVGKSKDEDFSKKTETFLNEFLWLARALKNMQKTT